MTHYDDDEYYIERPRRRSERSEPARVRDDEGELSREEALRRRLRDRTERAGDDDDDYDRPTTRVAGYPPPYARSGGGGGCAQAVLYTVLGVLAVVLVLVIVGPQLIGRFASGVPAEVAQVLASPTPTIRDRGGTIQQIRNLNRLETQSVAVERVIDAGVRGNALQDFLFGDRILLIASGNVVAGVDLSKLGQEDITLSADGTRITINLPPSEIFGATLDNSRTRVYDRQKGLLAAGDKDLETQARQVAEAEVLSAACEAQIMEKAANEAKRAMEQFLSLLEFDSVTVVAPIGQCVAPQSAPAATP